MVLILWSLSFPLLSLIAYAAVKATQRLRGRSSHTRKAHRVHRWASSFLDWLNRP